MSAFFSASVARRIGFFPSQSLSKDRREEGEIKCMASHIFKIFFIMIYCSQHLILKIFLGNDNWKIRRKPALCNCFQLLSRLLKKQIGIAEVVIEVFFKAFNEENTASYVSCILFVSENIRTSNDGESIYEIFLIFSSLRNVQ